MNIEDLARHIEGKVLTAKQNIDREVSYGYSCDLLSHVMANCHGDSIWVTVQTHLNVVAVASLLDVLCIVVPEDIKVEENTLARAEEEGIVIISTKLNAFEICGRLYNKGIEPCR